MYHDVPGHNGIIFRKHREDLYNPDGPITIAEKWGWQDKGADWNGARHRYTFPSGKTITFGFIGQSGSESYKRYKSAWFQDIFWDQVEEIDFKQYDWMRNRLGRLAGWENVPLRFWSAANPDGKEWVYEHFVKKETRSPNTWFIPATADDNPFVDLEALEATLRKIKDPIVYRQLREGVWGLSTAGGIFDPKNFGTIMSPPYGNNLQAVRYWDLAGTSEAEGGDPAYTVGVRMFRDPTTDLIYVDNVIRERLSPLEVEDKLRKTAMIDRKLVTDLLIRRIPTYIEREPGSSGKAIMQHYLGRVLPDYEVYEDLVSDPKSVRAGPWAAAVAAKRVYLVLGQGEGSARWMDAYKNEHRAFPSSDYKDQVDASSGAYNMLYNVSRPPKIG